MTDSSDETRSEELIRAHLDGSETAFGRLVELHAADLAAVLERMVKDPHLALDLAQEVFIKLHAMLVRYRFRGRFRSMLYAMALNRARDALRQRKRSRLLFLADPGRQVERRDLVEAALDRVPSPFQEALYLRDLVGLSYREVAATLGCSLGTVKSRVNRGRLAFRDRLEKGHVAGPVAGARQIAVDDEPPVGWFNSGHDGKGSKGRIRS